MVYVCYLLLFLLLGMVFTVIGFQIYTQFIQPGAIYYPTTDLTVERMLELAKVGPKDTLVDLGSGDGRILIAAAKRGAKAVGYEINPFLVKRSRLFIRQAGVEKLATVEWKSFWKADFEKVTVVAVYLFPHLMNRLQKLLDKKIKHPIRVVSNDYCFPKLSAAKRDHKAYLYYFGKKKSTKD